MGRSDDMFIIRGVNIYPSHIDEILSRQEGIGSEYQIHLGHLADGKDYMTIKVERAEQGERDGDTLLSAKIERAIRKETLVSGEVEIVDYQTLPRTERKSKRVFDHRN
jgi:phenylacetate-CoA ligase